jgi:hypothetical protein
MLNLSEHLVEMQVETNSRAWQLVLIGYLIGTFSSKTLILIIEICALQGQGHNHGIAMAIKLPIAGHLLWSVTKVPNSRLMGLGLLSLVH